MLLLRQVEQKLGLRVRNYELYLFLNPIMTQRKSSHLREAVKFNRSLKVLTC